MAESPETGAGPLAGMRVVELAVYVQGPIAGALLAMLGAEVIKAEPAAGDPTRQAVTASNPDDGYGPPPGFLWTLCNPNKQSALIDLREPGDRAAFEDLVRSADAFVTNLMEDALRRFGADRETITAINPRIVYGRAGGLGDQGPLAGDPCQDTVGMAYAGMMDVSSPVEGQPNYPQYAISDVLSGTMLAFGVVSSLLARERTGLGPAIRTSQLQTLMWAQMCNISAIATYGERATYPRHEIAKPRNPLMNMYEAGDGKWLAMGLIRGEHWEILMPMLGLVELLAEPRFETLAGRAEHSEELTAEIAAAFKTRPRDEWLAMMRAARLYVAKVNRIEELVEDEQVAANRFIVEREDGFQTVPMPFTVAGYEPPMTTPPTLGSWNGRAAPSAPSEPA